MSKKYANPQHLSDEIAAPSGMSMRSRAAAAISAGCLALALFPIAAIAAPADQGAQQPGGDGAVMQQPAGNLQASGNQPQTPSGTQAPNGNQQQAPSGMQAPSGNQQQAPSGSQQQAPSGTQAPSGNQQQAPNGNQQQAPSGTQAPSGNQAPSAQNGIAGAPAAGPSAERNAVDSQIREILSSKFGITMPSFDNTATADGSTQTSGKPGEAPEIPAGEINVQALIDTVHDMVRQYGADSLEQADFTDESFIEELKSFVKTATEKRLQAFSAGFQLTGGAPEGMLDNAAGGGATAAPGNAAPADQVTSDGNAQQAPDAGVMGKQLSSTTLNTVINFLVGVLGGNA